MILSMLLLLSLSLVKCVTVVIMHARSDQPNAYLNKDLILNGIDKPTKNEEWELDFDGFLYRFRHGRYYLHNVKRKAELKDGGKELKEISDNAKRDLIARIVSKRDADDETSESSDTANIKSSNKSSKNKISLDDDSDATVRNSKSKRKLSDDSDSNIEESSEEMPKTPIVKAKNKSKLNEDKLKNYLTSDKVQSFLADGLKSMFDEEISKPEIDKNNNKEEKIDNKFIDQTKESKKAKRNNKDKVVNKGNKDENDKEDNKENEDNNKKNEDENNNKNVKNIKKKKSKKDNNNPIKNNTLSSSLVENYDNPFNLSSFYGGEDYNTSSNNLFNSGLVDIDNSNNSGLQSIINSSKNAISNISSMLSGQTSENNMLASGLTKSNSSSTAKGPGFEFQLIPIFKNAITKGIVIYANGKCLTTDIKFQECNFESMWELPDDYLWNIYKSTDSSILEDIKEFVIEEEKRNKDISEIKCAAIMRCESPVKNSKCPSKCIPKPNPKDLNIKSIQSPEPVKPCSSQSKEYQQLSSCQSQFNMPRSPSCTNHATQFNTTGTAPCVQLLDSNLKLEDNIGLKLSNTV